MGLGKIMKYRLNLHIYDLPLVMQIGSFDDWNINNPNSAKLSSKNVECEEKPHSPRGGNNILIYKAACV